MNKADPAHCRRFVPAAIAADMANFGVQVTRADGTVRSDTKQGLSSLGRHLFLYGRVGRLIYCVSRSTCHGFRCIQGSSTGRALSTIVYPEQRSPSLDLGRRRR
jgi:hypothetical protein